MKVAIYPGSFDPITCGHMDIIERASKLFDKLIVTVMVNQEKKPVFTAHERVALLHKSTSQFKNIEITHFDGLLAEYAREKNAATIIKGLRAVSDFEYEFQMALVNRKLNPDLDTVFLMTSEKYMYLSSRVVKAVGIYGGDLSEFVPLEIVKDVTEKLFTGRMENGRRN
ncbi:MAG: pantetheine-phosphate adenylyltransferase [Clostridiales bacterium]|nr:pantetheine-phosphate adenylyltransferase [Clostridiales bacterium]